MLLHGLVELIYTDSKHCFDTIDIQLDLRYYQKYSAAVVQVY